jgi:catalase-peroxidase
MGFKTYGFAGGRLDDWEPDLVYWGPETKFLDDKRYSGDRKLEKPLAAVQMGLIYVNPEGPNGKPDPLAAAKDIRETFGRMGMNDEETVALIAGGHSFGKSHGAVDPAKCLGPEPAAASIEEQGLGWKNKCGKGNAEDTLTSGLEGAWTSSPVTWSTQYLNNLFNYEWVQTKSPAGATQWIPDTDAAAALVPDAHDKIKRHAPIMFTTDLALKFDPVYKEIAKRFQNDPKQFEEAFAKAWFKLMHRDMGPRARYLGSEVPSEEQIWQDSIPKIDFELVNASDIKDLKAKVLASEISITELIKTAWASAATFRGTDMRGGANGARIRLSPQKDWAVNNPVELAKVLSTLTQIQMDFNNAQTGNKKISLADMIVLAGAAAIEEAAKQRGIDVVVPFSPGRADALQNQTDELSFAALEPIADGFRNYYSDSNDRSPVDMLIERANLLTLTVPEMTVLIGGMRALNVNVDNTNYGVLTDKPGTLSNDFFVNLLDMSTEWKVADNSDHIYEGHKRGTDLLKWKATSVDLIFGSNSELRAIAEVYASQDAEDKFIKDFVNAWVKVMRLDRFDLS